MTHIKYFLNDSILKAPKVRSPEAKVLADQGWVELRMNRTNAVLVQVRDRAVKSWIDDPIDIKQALTGLVYVDLANDRTIVEEFNCNSIFNFSLANANVIPELSKAEGSRLSDHFGDNADVILFNGTVGTFVSSLEWGQRKLAQGYKPTKRLEIIKLPRFRLR